MIKAVLFDLDGTLLPMDQDVFTKTYFKALAKKLIPLGYDPEELIAAIWKGTAAMVQNDGSAYNEERFWNVFTGIYGEKAERDKAVFEEFYAKDFNMAKDSCGFDPQSAKTVKALKNAGIRVILASQPIFPRIAQENRMRWAGVDPADFEWITCYENSRYCKPNPAYYREIAKQIGLAPEDCLMVGNDVTEDMVAGTIGMKTFLVTRCLLNRENKDISGFSQGDLSQVPDYVG